MAEAVLVAGGSVAVSVYYLYNIYGWYTDGLKVRMLPLFPKNFPLKDSMRLVFFFRMLPLWGHKAL